MSDLEDDLLALAGGDSASEAEMLDVPLKRARSDESSRKRARAASDEEDEEEEGENDEENEGEDEEAEEADEDFAEDNDVDMEGEDDEEEEHNEELQNPYPLEGKYKDEQDRQLLLDMDEIEREQTLFERSQEMDRYNEKAYLQQRLKQQKLQNVEKKTRSSSRKTAATSSKLDKLSELRKQREQKSRRSVAADDFDEEDEEDEEEEELDHDDVDGGYGEDDEVVWGSGKSRFKPRSLERATCADINKVRVGRSFLSKYLYYRKFEDVIVKTFGKINVGMDRRTRRPMYRVVQIEEAINRPQKQYKLGDTKTDLFLLVSQNKSQTKEFPVSVFSDSDIFPDEFDRYVQELAKTNEDVPYADDVKDKAQQLHELMNSGLSNQDIDEIVSKKKQMLNGIRSYDAVYQKSKVMDELKIAKQEGDIPRVKELTNRLHKLESILLKDNERASRSSLTDMSKVNERNRKLNQTNIRKAELSQLRKGAETNDGDPFSRLKTTTRMYYEEMVNEQNKKALQDAQANYDNMIAEKNEQEAKIASSTYRVLGNFDKLLALVDVDYVPVL